MSCSKEHSESEALEGLRLLVTPFPQQQFNSTEDRRTVKASQGAPASIATPTPHQCLHAHRRRHSPQRASASHRHALASRRQHSAACFGSQRALKERRGFHRVRATRRLFRRRSANGGQKGINPLSAAVRFTSWANSRTFSISRAEAEPVRQAQSGVRPMKANPRPGIVLRQASAPFAIRRRTTPTTRCTT